MDTRRCGKCRRYMKYIQTKPSRMHCAHCNETYNLPQNGNIRIYKELKCPLDDFELLSWSTGARGKSYTFCPYCYNNPPFRYVVSRTVSSCHLRRESNPVQFLNESQRYEEGHERLQLVHAPDMPARYEFKRIVQLFGMRRRYSRVGSIRCTEMETGMQSLRRYHSSVRKRAQSDCRCGHVRLRRAIGHCRVQAGKNVMRSASASTFLVMRNA